MTVATKARVKPATVEHAEGDVKKIYQEMQKKMGKVPNIFLHMGNSPAVLQGFVGLNDAVSKTSLDPKLREQIALAVGQANQCNYCLSAHTAIAGSLGIPQQQILQARKGEAQDPKTVAILHFVKEVVEKRGNIKDQDIDKLKAAGVTEREIVEIILVININMFTNYFNHIVNTPIDFPEAPKLS